MRKRLFLTFSFALLFAVTLQAATELTVTGTKGNITFVTAKGKHLPLEKSDLVDMSTVVNIPFKGVLELLDRDANKKYVISSPGRATVAVLLKDERNSIENLTKDYVRKLFSEVTGNGKLTPQAVTEPAAITRKMAAVEKKGFDMDLDFDMSLDDDFSMDLDDMGSISKESMINDYRTFRSQCIKTYVNYMREAWQSYTGEAPLKLPEVKEVPPMFIPINQEGEEEEPVSYDQAMANGLKAEMVTSEEATDSWLSCIANLVKSPFKKIKKKLKKNKEMKVQNVNNDVIKEKPKEVKAPIPVAQVPDSGGVNSLFPFTVFGTQFQVRLDRQCLFTLQSTSESAVADAVESMADKKYDNLLYDCLRIRRDNSLSDWAYYQMLTALTDAFCGKGTNEATLMCGFLYSQSGYKVRIGRDGNRLVLLLASQHTIYNKPAFIMDGERFYIFDGDVSTLFISKASFPNETPLSLAISKAQKFGYAQSPERIIQSRDYPDFKLTIHTNRNLMSFYDTYLASTVNNNVMTRWAFYANSPMSEEVKSELYPQLHAYLDNLEQQDAVARLLNLIQTGLVYEYDDKVWGHDRAFFAEETLYYPYCDCEDRSILLARLVRDILGLKTILIYYPGHLAMAIRFTVPVSGDYIQLGTDKYYVCDPTYIAADPCVTMKGMDNSTAEVILLE